MKRLLFLPLFLLTAVGFLSPPASAKWNVTGVLPLQARSVAVNPVTNRIYVSTPNGVRVLDGLTHETLHTIPTYEPVHVSVDEKNNLLYLTGSELTLVDGATYRVLDSTVLDPNQHLGRATNGYQFFLTDRGCSAPECKSFIAAYVPRYLTITNWMTTPHVPGDLVAVPNTTQMYVSYARVPAVGFFTSSYNAVIEIPVQGIVSQFAYDAKNRILYALERDGKHLTLISNVDNKVTARYDLTAGLRAGEGIQSMALNQATGEIAFYARKFSEGTLDGGRIYRWTGGITTPASGEPSLKYEDWIGLNRPLNLWYVADLPYDIPHALSPGMTYNPATGRLYATYGERGFRTNPDDLRLIVIEDRPPTDTLPPTVTITVEGSPNEAGWYRTGVWATITARDNFNGLGVDAIAGWLACCDDAVSRYNSFTQIGNQARVLVPAPPANADPLWLEYAVRDYAGNETTGRATFKIDAVPPVTTPRFAGSPSGLTQVALEVEDRKGSGVASIWYHLDGGQEILYTGPFTVSSERTHELTYYARDIAGNVEAAKTMTVRLSGDLNGDLRVDITDVVRLLQLALGQSAPTPQELGAGDRDGNGSLDVNDAVLLLRRIAGI
ncbi:MAG: hypothetical protein KY468_02925 [Armatimonadetes bacterium]|nr:hypothetical protein [Armatimonadota bacterium]